MSEKEGEVFTAAALLCLCEVSYDPRSSQTASNRAGSFVISPLTGIIGTQCVYDETRSKPGMRTGAVENLSRRVGVLLLVSYILRPVFFL